MSKLFTPLQLRDLVLANRIVVSPMCQYSSNDGMADDWHLVHLGSRAVGGAGLVFTEATAVSPEGRISPHDLGIWKDEHIESLRRIVKFVRSQGSEIGIQLAHAGRKASVGEPWNGGALVKENEGGWQMVAPSPIPFNEHYGKPVELTVADIRQVVVDFRAAARRAMLAGFKIVEIHAAHGYLIHQFLSPLSNQRRDEYGGSFDNRIKLLLAIVDAVRAVWPPGYPLFVRISATDWAGNQAAGTAGNQTATPTANQTPGSAENGWSPDDAVHLAGILKDHGVDVIDCSSGGLVPYQKIPVGPGYQVDFARQIRETTGILTAAVGLITDAMQAETILATGQADLVVMARQLLRDPYFPLHAADQLRFKDIHWPLQYERARR